jgi:hypothetical protein
LATKFTYKMRSGGKGMWGRGPALYKQKLKKKKYLKLTIGQIYVLETGQWLLFKMIEQSVNRTGLTWYQKIIKNSTELKKWVSSLSSLEAMAARMSRPSNPTSALLPPPPFTPEAILLLVLLLQYNGGPVMLLQDFGYRCSNISSYLLKKETVSVSIPDSWHLGTDQDVDPDSYLWLTVPDADPYQNLQWLLGCKKTIFSYFLMF